MKKIIFSLTLVSAICVCAVMTLQPGKRKTALPSGPSFSRVWLSTK